MGGPALPLFGLAAGVGVNAFLNHVELPPARSRSEWLSAFGQWDDPSSTSEDSRIKRTERMVADAVANCFPEFPSGSQTLRQGSSENNTNVKLVSDVDLVVLLGDYVVHKFFPGDPQIYVPNTISVGASTTRDLSTIRSRVSSALVQKFGKENVDEGDKAFRVAATEGSRVECDVIPAARCVEYWSRATWSGNVPEYKDGIIFLTKEGREIISFPQQHLANGRAKNVATGRRYKAVTRILKKFRQEMKARQTILGSDLPSSNQIEALVYSVDDDVLRAGDLFTAVEGALRHIQYSLKSPELAKRLVQVNGFRYLYPQEDWQKDFFGDEEPPKELRDSLRFVERVHRRILTSS